MVDVSAAAATGAVVSAGNADTAARPTTKTSKHFMLFGGETRDNCDLMQRYVALIYLIQKSCPGKTFSEKFVAEGQIMSDVHSVLCGGGLKMGWWGGIV